MTSSKTMLCKIGATGPNVWNVIDDGIVYYSTKFYGIQIRGFWETSFWSLELFISIVWQNGLEYISCTPTWLPPYKPQEILQSLNDHNFDKSKSIDSKLLGGHLKWCTLPTDRFVLKITLNLNFWWRHWNQPIELFGPLAPITILRNQYLLSLIQWINFTIPETSRPPEAGM